MTKTDEIKNTNVTLQRQKEGKKTPNINYKTMEKEETKKRKGRTKWDATLKWKRVTLKDETILRFEINGYPFFLDEVEKNQLLNAIREINSTAHFIITSVVN